MRIIEYIKLIRVHQWYKNLWIFLSVFFVGELFSIKILEHAFIGFIALCLVSSANYIINDIIDIKSDRLHPEKRHREPGRRQPRGAPGHGPALGHEPLGCSLDDVF